MIELDIVEMKREEGMHYNYTDLHTSQGALMWTFNELTGEFRIYLGKTLSLITYTKLAVESFIDYYRNIQGIELELKREESNE